MWDPIMQVGKTPQITADANLNPYTIAQDDISQLAFPYLVSAGSSITFTGSVLNLTNQFYDYSVTDTIDLWDSSGAGSSSDTIITFDLGKAINVRGVSLLIASDRNSTDSNSTVYLEGSQDGITWIELDSRINPNTSGTKTFYTMQASDSRFKTLRIRVDWSAGSGGAHHVYLERLRIWVDSKQYFY